MADAMRLLQLRVLRWLGLGFANRRRRVGCAIVTVFIVILILDLLTYRHHDSVRWSLFVGTGRLYEKCKEGIPLHT